MRYSGRRYLMRRPVARTTEQCTRPSPSRLESSTGPMHGFISEVSILHMMLCYAMVCYGMLYGIDIPRHDLPSLTTTHTLSFFFCLLLFHQTSKNRMLQVASNRNDQKDGRRIVWKKCRGFIRNICSRNPRSFCWIRGSSSDDPFCVKTNALLVIR